MSDTVTASLQNFQTLIQNSAASSQAASKVPLNVDPGSAILALLEADAAQGLWLQYLVLITLGLTRFATSEGSDADSFGADFGYTRLPATYAVGAVTFARYSAISSAFVNVGAQVLTSDQTQTFNVTTDTTNANYTAGPPAGYNVPGGLGSITLPVQAVTPGVEGNVLAGTVTLIVGGISGIDTVTNASAMAGGVDAESDAAYKARFPLFINSRTQATETAVAYAVASIQQGLTWSLQENQTALGAYQPGTFVVTVDDGTGNPPGSVLTAVTAAIQAIRPIGSIAIVQGPTKILANISVVLTILPGADAGTITVEVEQALTAYVTSLPVGAPLPYSKISAICYAADTAITNVTGITLNSGTVDLVVTESQVIRPGTIAVS